MNIFLDKTEPNKINDLYKFEVIAQIRDGKKVVSNEPVQFYLGTKEYESPLLTEGDGRAVKEFFVPSGIYTIFAEISDGTRKKITIPVIKPEEEPPDNPTKIFCYESGSKGNYHLTIQVLMEKDKPAKKIKVRILDKDMPNKFYDLPLTDDFGLTETNIQFSEKEKNITIIVLGTSILIWKNLFN